VEDDDGTFTEELADQSYENSKYLFLRCAEAVDNSANKFRKARAACGKTELALSKTLAIERRFHQPRLRTGSRSAASNDVPTVGSLARRAGLLPRQVRKR